MPKKFGIWLSLKCKKYLLWDYIIKKKKKQFNYNNLDCKSTLCHPNNKLFNFHYKLLPNVLDLNKMLFKFGNIGSPLYSLCSLKDGLPYYLFYECSNTNYLWNQPRCIQLPWYSTNYFTKSQSVSFCLIAKVDLGLLQHLRWNTLW